MSELSIAESIRQDYEEEIHKKEAMYDSLAVDYRLAQEEIERLNKRIEDLNIINEEHKILNEMIRKELQQKENIIKEVREWVKKYSCQFTNDDGELVVSEISFNLQARPCDLFKILDKGE